MKVLDNSWDINSIISNGAVACFFQPIVSVVKKRVIGIEGLSRGIDPQGNLIPPYNLFTSALERGVSIELDRLCRAKALDHFVQINANNPDLLLFLNIDAAILDKVSGSDYLINSVRQRGLSPQNIVLEINESRVNDIGALKRFIDTYRSHGFLIALDDIGSGFSNLDRIPLAEPDIIKIDRGIIQNIDHEYYKQEVFKSLVNLAQKIGALVIAEGMEREEEALLATELGATMLQGFYFAQPRPFQQQQVTALEQRVEATALTYKKYMSKKIKAETIQQLMCNKTIEDISNELTGLEPEVIEEKLCQIISSYPFVECAYILNYQGNQISDTICNYGEIKLTNEIMFQPASRGMDHTLKKYYYYPKNNGAVRFNTEPYISLATGNICVTISQFFKDDQGEDYLLCLDFNPKPVV